MAGTESIEHTHFATEEVEAHEILGSVGTVMWQTICGIRNLKANSCMFLSLFIRTIVSDQEDSQVDTLRDAGLSRGVFSPM